ncbi:hypothetical protein [Pseudomonas schmalbachii]|uniref:Tetratricopeptide repeat protein n=1 Tax=Pseudomonas schmalbachii TaxID=2816993 RepID=A0ABS3TIX3_9PSED|nr:hypothetical protein [Pseudomonas schmalbachii]MBO3273617.1 hypothetical protein [Pseudomonas schmalbachii]
MVEYPEELPDNIYERVIDLSVQGNLFLDSGDALSAVNVWCEALALLPSPKDNWEACLWLNASLGEAYRVEGQLEEAKACLLDALNCPDGHVNPFVLLRLGQTLVDLGDENAGVDYLLRAYMLEGEEIFEEDAQYLQLLRNRKLVD